MFPSHSPAIYDFLKEQRLVAVGQLDELNEEHKATGKPLADVVVDLGIVEKDELLRRIAIHLGGFEDCTEFSISENALSRLLLMG